MGFKKALLVWVGIFLLLFCSNSVWAAFGISPPFVKSDKLTPGSHYQQQILLSRSDPNEDVLCSITINAPEIEEWISIEPGFEFILPKGKNQVPMFVNVNVPKNAKLGDYSGKMRVKVKPTQVEGKVAIALGAQIEVALTVGSEGLVDFLVRSVEVSDVFKKPWPWIFSFLNKARVSVAIENTGNVPGAPSRVELEIYDIFGQKLLESGQVENLAKIEPFEQGSVLAEFSTKLAAGEYFAVAKIYKGSEIVEEWKAVFNIVSASFSIKEWLLIIAVVLGLIIIIAVLILIFLWRRKKR